MLDPRQGDFPRGKVPTVKDALRSIHWKLDDRPIAMKLYEFAAIDGPVDCFLERPAEHENDEHQQHIVQT
ncbi:MAG TPA: hypothetical protein VGI47_07955 [Candidatus Binataceae bacterium]